jgi:ABC-type dipeptide/oligopeptide/nickel transport system permease component
LASAREAFFSWWQTFSADFSFTTGQRWSATVTDTGFVLFFGRLFSGTLYSHQRDRYVFSLIAERWSVSFTLQFLSILLAWSISLPLGIRMARRLGSKEERLTGGGLFFLWSLPDFFVGALLLHYFCTSTPEQPAWFPSRGLTSEDAVWLSTPQRLLDLLWHGFLPLIVLSYGSFTVLSRYMRGSVLDQLSADYVRTARAKGCGEDRVLYGHAVRNSLITMITLGSGLLAALFGGFVVVEELFAINGLGRLLLEAARTQDVPLLMGSTVISVVLLLVSILLADLAYAWADPRLRGSYG